MQKGDTIKARFPVRKGTVVCASEVSVHRGGVRRGAGDVLPGGGGRVKEQTVEYLRLYFECGWRMSAIARHFGVSTSTVSRCISRAERRECPFAKNCRYCPLKECAIKEEYAPYVNAEIR